MIEETSEGFQIWKNMGEIRLQNINGKKTIILTPAEGNCIERLYTQYGCANISQFCKAIVHGEIQIASEPITWDNPDFDLYSKDYVAKLEEIRSAFEKIKNVIDKI
mgnify:CR=1 FL=1